MQTESSALVVTRFGTQENLHPAQWAAQLVIGYRAFRRLVSVGSAAAEASTANDTEHVCALPPHEPR